MNTYLSIKEKLNGAKLCIVTKKRSKEQIMFYYDQGERIFGENKAQELLTKIDLPSDIQWHFIGHLQTNKVKDVVAHVELIHSVDRLNLVKEIEKEAAKLNKVQKILIQFNIAEEETKSGIAINEAESFFEEVSNYPHLEVKGIMCMGPHVEDEKRIEEVFEQAHNLFNSLKEKYPTIDTLSMGMSGDYLLALR
ncbi:MAG: YggS family pyridoxal phosphate-dependent enzyme, partial [Erysipelotrichaceae bacterium]|nr:YggS family pyridoxal phosphate-dependent enzyme [Erysipelotrichaceae bacterium]